MLFTVKTSQTEKDVHVGLLLRSQETVMNAVVNKDYADPLHIPSISIVNGTARACALLLSWSPYSRITPTEELNEAIEIEMKARNESLQQSQWRGNDWNVFRNLPEWRKMNKLADASLYNLARAAETLYIMQNEEIILGHAYKLR